MYDAFIGTIILFAGHRIPEGWLLCDGSLLNINHHSALYAIIGNMYGGNGHTFALPDLRGRVAVSSGHGPGLQNYKPGVKSGQESVTLLPTQLPAHTHSLSVSNAVATATTPTPGATLATMGTKTGMAFTATLGYNSAVPNTVLHKDSISTSAAATVPVDVLQPSLCVNYIICVNGIYPSFS